MNTIIEINSEEQFKETVDNNTGRLVALFTAPAWCPPCRAFEPQFDKLPELTDATLVRINIDKNVWTAGDIMSVPTIRLFEGSEHIRDLHADNADAFVKTIED